MTHFSMFDQLTPSTTGGTGTGKVEHPPTIRDVPNKK
jgi:hypothetical protein